MTRKTLNRIIFFEILFRLLTVCLFIGSGIAGWKILECFTDHNVHGKLNEGLGTYYDIILFAFVEFFLIFIPRFRWKILLFAAYFALMCWQWSPSYTPYRFLYHAVFATMLMILVELIHKRFIKHKQNSTVRWQL